MVIIRTSAIEVSIQAVSPELGVQFSSTAFLGSGLPAQAGGMSDAAAGVASSAYDEGVNAEMLRNRPSNRVNTRARRPARDGFLNVMIYSCRWVRVRALRHRFRRCGCARRCRGRE